MKIGILFSLLVVVILPNVFSQTKTFEHISYVEITPSCYGEIVNAPIWEKRFEVIDDDMFFNYLGSNIKDLKFYRNDKLIEVGTITHMHPDGEYYSFRVEFVLSETKRTPHIIINEKRGNREINHKIVFKSGYYNLHSKLNILNFNEACQDTILINFPPMGTETAMSLCKLTNNNIIFNTIDTAYCCGYPLALPFTKKDTGVYRVELWGCYQNHSIFDFELK